MPPFEINFPDDYTDEAVLGEIRRLAAQHSGVFLTLAGHAVQGWSRPLVRRPTRFREDEGGACQATYSCGSAWHESVGENEARTTCKKTELQDASWAGSRPCSRELFSTAKTFIGSWKPSSPRNARCGDTSNEPRYKNDAPYAVWMAKKQGIAESTNQRAKYRRIKS
jgi:hypothetical protein